MRGLILLIIIFPLLVESKANTAQLVKKVYILGDSITEGYGVKSDQAFPALLQKLFDRSKVKNIRIIAAGVSGSTTASGKKRLQWIVKANPVLVVLALGANDGLRGISAKATEKNLVSIINFGQKNNIKMVLAGMKVPPNYGKKYEQQYSKIWPRLSHRFQIVLIPFLLAGVAGEKAMNQEDGIHPNYKGHKLIAKNIFKFIKGEL